MLADGAWIKLAGDVQLIIPLLVEKEVVLVTVCVERRRGMLVVVGTASVCGLTVDRKLLSTGVFEVLTVEKDGGVAKLLINDGLSSDWRIGEG